MRQITQLPLHGGKAPRWLFPRMVRLGGAIAGAIMEEFGPDELLSRLCDSDWFQALSCAIGYDWHSSGTTTVTMGALKEALKEDGEIFIAGGKGKAGVNTPNDIISGVDRLSIPSRGDKFIELSRLSAKIDATMVYENTSIYHHTFLFTKRKWGVVQQAMNKDTDMATRFQWFSDLVDQNDISNEPHSGINGTPGINSLDLTNRTNLWVKPASVAVLPEAARPEDVFREYPKRHGIYPSLDLTKRGIAMLRAANEVNPKDYRELLLIKGVGRTTIRSLAIISSLIYDKELAQRDPVAYSYNLGGKDSIPYKINLKTYDRVIAEMENIVDSARISTQEKYKVLKSLNSRLN